MKLLLADSQHSLGVALEHELERESFHLTQPAPDAVDWHSADSVRQYVMAQRPAVVINNLGWGDTEGSARGQLLRAGAAHLAAACAERSVPMVHLSSYRVFGDDNKSKHSERDEPGPNSELGRDFLAAEQSVLEALDKALVLRSSWVVASYGDNRLTRLLEALTAGQSWRLNARLRGAPTALSDLARVTVAVVKQIACGAECWGVYHYCSGDACTEVEFAEHLLEVLQQQAYRGPQPNWDVYEQTPQCEPVSAVLGSLKLRNDFGVQARTWRTYLLPMVKQWLHQARD